MASDSDSILLLNGVVVNALFCTVFIVFIAEDEGQLCSFSDGGGNNNNAAGGDGDDIIIEFDTIGLTLVAVETDAEGLLNE